MRNDSESAEPRKAHLMARRAALVPVNGEGAPTWAANVAAH